MPLNEREQKILEEIERQFRAEDPDLVRAASSLPLARFAKRSVRLLMFGAVGGLILMLATFSFNTILALIGFGLMVVSATALVQSFKGPKPGPPLDLVDGSSGDGMRNRWPFRR